MNKNCPVSGTLMEQVGVTKHELTAVAERTVDLSRFRCDEISTIASRASHKDKGNSE